MLLNLSIANYIRVCKICFFLFILFQNKINAQNSLGFVLGGGPMYYMGELQSFSFPNIKLINPSIGIGICIRPINTVNLRIEYLKGTISGADSISVKSFSQSRNLFFFF